MTKTQHSKQQNKAKKTVLHTCSVFISSLCLLTVLLIAPFFSSELVAHAATLTGLQDPAQNGLLKGTGPAIEGGQSLTNMEIVISRIIGGLTIVASIFFVVYFFLASFTWVTAGGDAGKIQKARDQMVQAALGLIVIIMAYSIMGAIGAVLGIDILNPASQIRTIFFGLQPIN